MRLASIDIGTNSMRLLICDYDGEKFSNRKKYVNTTRLGQGVDENGMINEESMKRNIDALVEFYDTCKSEGCEKIYCMGTSALRDSKNKDVFIKLAKEKANIDVQVLSGEEESNLGFMGVLEGCNYNEDIIVIDIGGGSTEYILGNSEGIYFSKSENVGALRMTEKFITKDPICDKEMKEMQDYIEKTIESTIDYIKEKKVFKLIGIGGTTTSLSAMNQELEVYSMEKIHDSKIFLKDVELILQKLENMTINDKKQLKGLQQKRADIITAGVKILQITMKKLEIEYITVSEYDNLEGLICQNLKKMY